MPDGSLALLADLPVELYETIIGHLSADDLTPTLLSLSRAIPRSPVPLHLLLRTVQISRPEQVVQLHRRLHRATEERSWVHHLSLHSWTLDPDVVINLIKLLPSIITLRVHIGLTFGPEHVQELVQKPLPDLKCLVLRFRPYVQRATYYQFLKGAYYDPVLTVLAAWPTSSLARLSIVQDPLDAEISKQQRFAQPLVFFRLDPLTTLINSPCLRPLISLRISVPSRQVVRFICNVTKSVPRLDLLDLSTCNISLNDIEVITSSFPDLRHLVLDRCDVGRVIALRGGWSALGKACALSTVKRAKDREKKLKTWLERNPSLSPAPAPPAAVQNAMYRRSAKAGRKGVATATISLREPSSSSAQAPPPARPPGGTNVVKVRIYPSTPKISSINTSEPDAEYEVARGEFEEGWEDGITQVFAVRNRLHTSWKNKIKVMRFTEETISGEGFDGLEDIPDAEYFDGAIAELAAVRTPLLCLSGVGAGGSEHALRCGHKEVETAWGDAYQ
ncbi:hypothetical protein CONPUDRAFT_134261 [Coniophora puteana RWD-64-598 SS2]|uniref:F-box domain-containing protein n=1 Tax=Coniophora puteana (strain RWD-64-598) TaxID=741705 RepID=A0A5M3N7T5_CONPW|nr:uncharacterized protein CONPUDRAFT_134261 [Coniophora puteana RWD-64-598 SS2]EIW86921.1 hypothetical protein CONPUDRAFT_134261 [Coniophora puteana RWD-64-598 SS2]